MNLLNIKLINNTFKFLSYSLIFIFSQSSNAQEYDWTRTNPGAGGAFNIAKVGPTGLVVACSDLSGAYISKDRGASWQVLGSNVGMDQTHASTVGFHTQDENVFCIGTEYGIFLTTNGGQSFTKTLNDGYIEDISYSTSNTNIAYAAYHPQWNSDDGSVYKTIDSGNTWQKVSIDLPSNKRILKIESSPLNAALVFCLSGAGDFACSDALLFKSINGGINWTQIDIPAAIMDFELSATDQNHVMLTTMNADCNARFYWTDVEGAYLESKDQGDTWNVQSQRTGIIWIEDQKIKLIDPREPYPWIETAGTWESSDEGENWNIIGTVENLETAFPGNLLWSYGTTGAGICKTLGESLTPGIRYWAHNRFIYGTEDGGISFNNKFSDKKSEKLWTSRGVDNVVMYDLEINEIHPDMIFAGYWDIGLWRSMDKGMNWEYCSPEAFTGNWRGNGGNAMSILSDPDRPNVVWATMKGDFYEDAFLLRSNDAGSLESWELSNQGLAQSPGIFSLTYLPDSPIDNRELLVSSGGQIFKSNDDGRSWTLKESDDGIRVFEVDQHDSDIIYAGGEHGLWRSTDRGETWSETGIEDFRGGVDGPSFAYAWEGVTDICSDPFHESTVYISVLGPGKGLYKSCDSGLSWDQIYSNDFMRSIELSKNISGKIYAGSSSAYSSGGLRNGSAGILMSTDAGTTWIDINENTPFPFALTIDVMGIGNDTIFIGSPGTGFQYGSSSLVSSTDQGDALSVDDSSEINIYPNPVHNIINIEWKSSSSNRLEIIDLLGVCHVKSKIDSNNNSRIFSTSIAHLPNGVYIIKLIGDKTKSLKILKF